MATEPTPHHAETYVITVDDVGHSDVEHVTHTGHGDQVEHLDAHGSSGPVDWPMFFWFLLVFAVAAYILKKYALGPILAGLEEREAEIEQSLNDAEAIQREMAQLDSTVKGKIADADAEAKTIVDQAREGAREAARGIESQAREQAQILRENADRDIATARGKAEAALKAHSAEVAVELATKLLAEKLDAKGRSALADRLIAEM